MSNPYFLIIGGGIMGLAVSREIKKRHPQARIRILEKESALGLHASGRNSGVLHAGFYYTPDSLKAKMTRQGNQLLTAFCESRKLPINKCGKLVVAKNEAELPSLRLLLERGRANGVPLEEVSESEAKKMEPRVKTTGKALFSPSTSVVNPVLVVQALHKEAIQSGVEINLNEGFAQAKDGRVISTTGEVYESGFVVNAGGLYADVVARQFGFSKNYKILPFKGLYLYSDEPNPNLRRLVYPVPDLNYPFL